jgi:hypothetical protein
MQTRVNDVHPGITQRARDDARTAVMAVEADFRNQNSNR